jgi:hypothetical protein
MCERYTYYTLTPLSLFCVCSMYLNRDQIATLHSYVCPTSNLRAVYIDQGIRIFFDTHYNNKYYIYTLHTDIHLHYNNAHSTHTHTHRYVGHLAVLVVGTYWMNGADSENCDAFLYDWTLVRYIYVEFSMKCQLYHGLLVCSMN